MIEFDDKDIQNAFDECYFRKEFEGADVCRDMCMPCERTIESGQCTMLKNYFSKRKGGAENEL